MSQKNLTDEVLDMMPFVRQVLTALGDNVQHGTPFPPEGLSNDEVREWLDAMIMVASMGIELSAFQSGTSFKDVVDALREGTFELEAEGKGDQ